LIAKITSDASDLHGRIGAELADRVEDKLDLWPGAGLCAAVENVAECYEICSDVLFAEKHNADGECDLGIDDSLIAKRGGGVFGEESVVFRLSEERCGPFVEFEELREVASRVAGVNVLPIESNSIFFRERHDAMREQRAFEMEMEFGFGEFAEEVFDFGGGTHGDSLAGEGKSRI
jgi:hypothetical protein